MPLPPWSRPEGIEPVVRRWLSSGAVRPCLADQRELPAEPADACSLPDDLGPSLRDALGARGIDRLYDHQARAVASARVGRHTVVATPTASGKSLCFHLPVLEALAKDPGASAIYLYPTKALARDQEAGLLALLRDAGVPAPAIVYDGDTPGDARRAARERARIVMTNPDMLHAGILPHHAHWAKTFQRLRYVVVDELHVYRGVFGSHFAHVLARLRRAARFHGSSPTFLCATATIGNPGEHAARLLGAPEDEISVVDRSGAPRGRRRFFVYNPPVVNAELGVRASYLKSAVRLAADLVRARVPTIVFGQSRNAVEIMLKYLRDALSGENLPEGAIMAYRGGYLPEARRRVERGLRDGEILCVVATSALELGIDVGDLDAVVCAGYPGSVAETFQRFGRAGRRGRECVCVLVTSSAPVDQYLAGHPESLFGAVAEEARIDPANTEVLVQHLKCAAFELPFAAGEAYAPLSPEDTREALRFLAGHGVLFEAADRFHWSADAYPANHVSLRSVGWDNFVIVDRAHGRTLAELDFRAAHTMLHEQAIYQHDGEPYQVERLDYENHKAFVTKVESDYFTTAMVHAKVSVIEEVCRAPLGAGRAASGEVSVVEKVVGYKKVKFHTHENAGYGEVRLPDLQMHTQAFWLTLPAPATTPLGLGPAAVIEGLRGLGQALETASAVALMCDPRDLRRTLGDAAPEDAAPEDAAAGEGGERRYEPTLYVYESVPGGTGLTARIFERRGELAARAKALVARCPCEAGCPLCVGAPAQALAGAQATPKALALALLDLLVVT